MKQTIFFLTLLIPTLICASSDEEKMSTAEIEEFAQHLIEKHNPTKERCGAGAHKAHKEDDRSTWRIDTDEGSVSCMIAGYKNVAWIDSKTIQPSTFKKLLASYNIQQLYLTGPVFKKISDLILYTPQGKDHAKSLQAYLELCNARFPDDGLV